MESDCETLDDAADMILINHTDDLDAGESPEPNPDVRNAGHRT